MKLILRNLLHVGAGLAVLALVVPVPAQSVSLKSRDVKWVDTPGIKGAQHSAFGDGGTFHRLPINQLLTGENGARVVVLLGSISVEIDGEPAGEYGPGSYVSVPAGSSYTLIATAAGECTFAIWGGLAGPRAAWRSRDLKWTDTSGIKGAQQSALGEGGKFHRLPFNQMLAGDGDARVVVLLGSISVEIDGEPAGEYGPGSYVSVPAGRKYTLIATAAGECTFFLQ